MEEFSNTTNNNNNVETSFSNHVAHFMMEIEELRQSLGKYHQTTTTINNNDNNNNKKEEETSTSVTIHQLIHWQMALERTYELFNSLTQWVLDDATSSTQQYMDLYYHCHQKAIQIAQQTLRIAFDFDEPFQDNDEEEEDNMGNDTTTTTTTNNNHDMDSIPVDIIRRDGQCAIARITELNLLFLYHSLTHQQMTTTQNNAIGGGQYELQFQTPNEIIDLYVAYQKQVLRLRARPAIAELVEARREGKIITPTATANVVVDVDESTDIRVQVHNDDDDNNMEQNNLYHHNKGMKERITIRHYHSPVFTIVLGEASALIHPLMQWKFSLPPPSSSSLSKEEPPIVTSIRKLCQEAITTVDEQTQQLVKRISDWYWEDRPIDEWMQKSAQIIGGEEYRNDTRTEQDREQLQRELSILDGLVEEMAFSCQLLARYENLLHPLKEEQEQQQHVSKSLSLLLQSELLPEWNWKYATLERYLSMRQWQSALENATPVRIVLGTDVQVPSVVEDAQYLSTRALERAASTRSLQAIGTVAHAVCHDVWSIEMISGVHQSLLDKRGCWSSPRKDDKESEKPNEKEKATNSGFASALLEALDDDIAKDGPPRSPPKSGAPVSGSGFLSSIVSSLDENVRMMQLDMEFCVLNGLYAASSSCRSLVTFLDSLLSEDESSLLPASDNDKSMAMIQLAREELSRYENEYRLTLHAKLSESLESWCGTGSQDDACPPNFRGKALNHLRYFLEHENYHLDSASFAKAEADERLEHNFLRLLKESEFLSSLGNKCDADVICMLAETLSSKLVDIFRQSIWECESMFTDCGSLLLSKQFRMIQGFVTKVTQSSNDGPITPNLFQIWEPLSQIVFVLQLEKPADWLAYQSTSVLSPDDLARTMRKRIDFPPEAVQAIVAQIQKSQET